MNESYEDIIGLDRPITKIQGMEVAHRAKIFAPFAALKGFEECVREKEISYETRRILSDDQNEWLNKKFCSLQNGDYVKITYFKPSLLDMMIGQYLTIEGAIEFTKIPSMIQVNDMMISIKNVIEIENNNN